MDLILILGIVVLILVLCVMAQVFLLHTVTTFLKLERASLKKAFFTMLMSIPVVLVVLFVVGTALASLTVGIPENLYKIVSDVVYFLVATGLWTVIILWQYKTVLRNALIAGVSLALLSSLVLAVLGYLIGLVSFT